jgi:uncharacterized membrane protein YadS
VAAGGWRRAVVPLFVVGFVAASLLRTVGMVGAGLGQVTDQVSTVAIAVALAGVGLSVHPAHIRRAGFRPILLGAVQWVTVAASSLALQHVTR